MSIYLKQLPIKKINIERPRHKKRGGNYSKKKKSNTQHGDALKQNVTLLKKEFGQAIGTNPPEFNPAFIFRLKLEESVNEDQWRRSGLTLLNEEPNNIVVLFSPDQLTEFQRRIEEYSQQVPINQKNPRYAWLATITDEMSLWGYDDRIGKKLAGKVNDLTPTEEYLVDVELWHYGTRDDCFDRKDELQEFVTTRNGRFLDSYIGHSLSLARLKISGDTLTELLNVGIVRLVDFPPKPQLSVSRLLGTPLDDFPHPVSSPPDDAPGICIIDSGIHRGHPMLGAAIGDTRAIPSQIGSSLDQNGHGTMVAGIALYGNVQECIEKLTFTPQFYLYGARVTNAKNSFDDEKLIVNQMQEAIETFHREYGCRVFNVSLGDPQLIYKGGKPSPWAYILDKLVRELDVVIVVSAGNLALLPTSNQKEAEKIMVSYPHYLLNKESKIIEPATAANVITVGSLTHSETSYFMTRYPNDPSIRCVAALDQPSPFTRSGLGVNNAIKPDVCEYGGNIVWQGRFLNKDPEVGIVSMNLKHLNKLFATDIGTSFAAPKVAHLAALILNTYPGVSANLVRALIANAADVPAPTRKLLNDDEMKILKLCGYGRPEPQRALFSSANRVTLIAQDAIVLDRLQLYEIPIPDQFKKIKGERRITVSLAFDPPVRHTRKDYLGVSMSFRLFRGLKTERIIEWYAKREANFKPEKFANKYECKMIPSSTKREGGTLQKATFAAKRNQAFTNYEGDVFHLLVICKSGWASPEEFENQTYGLAVTIEHKEHINVYNLVEQQVRLPQRIRIRS